MKDDLNGVVVKNGAIMVFNIKKKGNSAYSDDIMFFNRRAELPD